MADTATIVENVNNPGHSGRVNAAKHTAMRAAFMAVMENAQDGLSHADAKVRILPLLPRNPLPGGRATGWRIKIAPRDMDAGDLIVQRAARPLTFYAAS